VTLQYDRYVLSRALPTDQARTIADADTALGVVGAALALGLGADSWLRYAVRCNFPTLDCGGGVAMAMIVGHRTVYHSVWGRLRFLSIRPRAST
jgi:hypothetical protein